MKIPFSWMHGSWGLHGKTRQIAEAEYYLKGEELQRRLVEITVDDPVDRAVRMLDLDLEHGHINGYTHECRVAALRLVGDELRRQNLLIDLKYERIDAYSFDTAIAEIEKTGDDLLRTKIAIDLRHHRITAYEHDVQASAIGKDEKQATLAKLDVDLKHGKLSQHQHDRQMATLKEEPYIAVIKSGYDVHEGINGLFFEFDWNDLMIEYLRLHGYHGVTDDEIIESWFSDICRSVADEDERQTPNGGRTIRRFTGDDGTSEYS